MSILFSDFFAKNNVIRPQEADFTEVLASIALVPKMLYFYGKMPEKRPKSVAIVGTRKFTHYGESVAYRLAYTLAKCGVVVVSGLAYGIDSIAHRGALDGGGVTVAVLGTPIDEIYPKEHLGLAREIVQSGGVVMSELDRGEIYYPKTCFLKRNRLIAGLADVVVVVEAAERSGSLNTAAHALEQGKEVFAVPGDVTRPMSRGCNQLIADGANVYMGAESVLEVLFPQARRRQKAKTLPEARKTAAARSNSENAQSTLFEAKNARKGKKLPSSAKMGARVAVEQASGGQNHANGSQKPRQGYSETQRLSDGALSDSLLQRADSAAERAILEQLLAGVESSNAIIKKTGLSVAKFSQTMTLLEIKQLVTSGVAGGWKLKG